MSVEIIAAIVLNCISLADMRVTGPTATANAGGCFTMSSKPVSAKPAPQSSKSKAPEWTIVRQGRPPLAEEKSAISATISLIRKWEVYGLTPPCEGRLVKGQPTSMADYLADLLAKGSICIETKGVDERAATAFPSTFTDEPMGDSNYRYKGEGTVPSIHINPTYLPRPAIKNASNISGFAEKEVSDLAAMLLHEAWHLQVDVTVRSGNREAWEIGAYSWCASELSKLLYVESALTPACRASLEDYICTCAMKIDKYVRKQ